MLLRNSITVFMLGLSLAIVGQARATILTFEVFDPDLDRPPYNDPLVLPVLPNHGYYEGFAIPQEYGDNVASSPTSAPSVPINGVFQYEFGAEGNTPNIEVSYGPTSIFTGGPNLWREGYGDLNGILYQGSRHFDPQHPVGTNYNILDIVLYGDPTYDVVLYGFELGAARGDKLIDAVAVYPGVPYPFVYPTSQIFLQPNVLVEGDTNTAFDFSAAPLQRHVIWIRIYANNLGDDSEFIGIDNIRFGQVYNEASREQIDPEFIDGILADPVPEPGTLAMLGAALIPLGLVAWRRRRAA